MDNTWGFHNMRVTEPLRVDWKREIEVQHIKRIVGDQLIDGDFYALKYTRTRTKKWEYIGLTQEAAKACVAQMSSFLNRIQVRQAIDFNKDYVPYFKFAYSRDPRNWNRVRCGTAGARQVSGESFTVSVDLQEVLSYYSPDMTPVDNADFVTFFELHKWFKFENYPTGKWPQFRGGDAANFSLVKDFDTFEKPSSDLTLCITQASYVTRNDGIPYTLRFGVAGNAVEDYNSFLLKCYKHGTDIFIADIIGFDPGKKITRDELIAGSQPFWASSGEVYDLEIVAYDGGVVKATSNRMMIEYGE